MQVLWYDSATSLNTFTNVRLLVLQGVTGVILYWRPGTTLDIAETVRDYIDDLGSVSTGLGRTIGAYAEIPRAPFLTWRGYNPEANSEQDKIDAAAEIATYVRNLDAFFVNSSSAPTRASWLLGWYLADEPGAGPLRSVTPEDVKQLAWLVKRNETFGAGAGRPTLMVINAANSANGAAFLQLQEEDGLARAIDFLFFDDYPVDRYLGQYPHGAMASDLAAPANALKMLADLGPAPGQEVGFVVQAFGYDPRRLDILGSLSGYTKQYTRPTLLETRFLTWLGCLATNSCIAYWVHYLNDNQDIGERIAPVTREVFDLMSPGFLRVGSPALTTMFAPLPGADIALTNIEVQRADGTWDTLWTGLQGLSLGLSGTAERPIYLAAAALLTPAVGASLDVGDQKFRVRFAKTSSLVGIELGFSISGRPEILKLEESYDYDDPRSTGILTPWQGHGSYQVEFDVAALQFGRDGAPFVYPVGNVVTPGGIVLTARPLETTFLDPRAFAPTADSGHNLGLVSGVYVSTAITPTSAYVVFVNASPNNFPGAGGLIWTISNTLTTLLLPTVSAVNSWYLGFSASYGLVTGLGTSSLTVSFPDILPYEVLILEFIV